MTKFIESFSTTQLLPPWQSRNFRMWSFLVDVDRARIQDQLNYNFNCRKVHNPAPYHYEALNEGLGLLCVARHPDFSSLEPTIQGWGPVSHEEVYWTFPAWRSRITPDNLLVEPTLVWIQSFVLDTNSFLMFSAREIWGTEMEMATIMLTEGDSPGTLVVDVAIEGLVEFKPTQASHLIGFMRARMDSDAKAAKLPDLLDKNPRLVDFVDLLIDAGLFTQDGTALVGGQAIGMELNTLKQFRDALNMDLAAYRALVTSRTIHDSNDDIQFFDGQDVKLEFLWSDSMREVLVRIFGCADSGAKSGLQDTPPGFGLDVGRETIDWSMPRLPIKVELAFSYTANATYDVLDILHTY